MTLRALPDPDPTPTADPRDLLRMALLMREACDRQIERLREQIAAEEPPPLA